MAGKAKKIFKTLLIGIPILLVVVLVILFLSINSIIKGGIETIGPKVMQAPVTVRSVRINPLSGRGVIEGLVVGNPEGFKTDSAFKLDGIELDLKLSSLKSKKTIILRIVINRPEITYERALKTSNIDQLLKNINEFGDKDDDDDDDDDDDEDKPDKKLIVKHFELNEATARVSITAMRGNALSATLPNILMTDIGAGGDGATGSEVFAQVMQEILESLAATSADAADVLEDSGKALAAEADKLEGTINEEAQKAKDAAVRGADSVKDASSKVTGGLKGLLGGDKDDK